MNIAIPRATTRKKNQKTIIETENRLRVTREEEGRGRAKGVKGTFVQ